MVVEVQFPIIITLILGCFIVVLPSFDSCLEQGGFCEEKNER